MRSDSEQSRQPLTIACAQGNPTVGDVAGNAAFKHELPNYGVFDEKRVFVPGPLPEPVEFRGVRVGLPTCEDIWFPDVTRHLASRGAQLLLVPNGSPFEVDKFHVRVDHGPAWDNSPMFTHTRCPEAATRMKLFATVGLVVGVALVSAACGGGTSDQKQPADTGVEAPAPPPGPLSVEWTDADLEKTGERVGYGSKPAAILSRDAQGALVFTPQTERDHLATRFAGLQAHEGERTLELVLDVKTPGGEGCAAHLQDQAFNLLATAPCNATGEQRTTATLPSGVTGVRVYFQSPKREPLKLPALMRLTEQR